MPERRAGKRRPDHRPYWLVLNALDDATYVANFVEAANAWIRNQGGGGPYRIVEVTGTSVVESPPARRGKRKGRKT